MDAVADCSYCDGRRRLSGQTDFINAEVRVSKSFFMESSPSVKRDFLFMDFYIMTGKKKETGGRR